MIVSGRFVRRCDAKDPKGKEGKKCDKRKEKN